MQTGFDDKWFKEKKRLAGVTNAELGAKLGRDHTVISKLANGSQPMSMDWARVFSDTLQVPLAEVMQRTGMVEPKAMPGLVAGFSEGDAAPWAAGPGVPEAARIKTVAQVFGERPGVDVFRVKSFAMALGGLLPGDFILVDTFQEERVKAGDVVIAQIINPRGATTILRRYEPPVLVAASADPADGRVHVVDGVNVHIRGKVVATWRV